MISWRVKQTVCGLDELCEHGEAGVTHLLSILDPEVPEPAEFDAAPPLERLTLRFHDIIEPTEGQVMPTKADMEAILAFGRTLPDGDPAHLLVHCHMGISRSTAAMTAIMLQAHPDADEDAVIEKLYSIRRRAWPNSVMIGHADELLGRGGRLMPAVARLYRRQIETRPEFVEPLRRIGRAAEVAMGEAA